MGVILGTVIIAVIILSILASCIKIVPQAYAFVIERLGGYQDMVCGTSHQSAVYRQSRQKGDFKRAGGGFSAAAGYHKG